MLWELPELLWKAAGFGTPRPALCGTLHPRNASSGLGSAGIAGIVRGGVGWRIWLRQDAAAVSCAVNEIPSPLFSWNYGFCHGKSLESRGLFCSPCHTTFASTLGNGKRGCRQPWGPRLEGRRARKGSGVGACTKGLRWGGGPGVSGVSGASVASSLSTQLGAGLLWVLCWGLLAWFG